MLYFIDSTNKQDIELINVSKEVEHIDTLYTQEQIMLEIETQSKRVNDISKAFSVHLFITSSFSERSAVVLTDDVLKMT